MRHPLLSVVVALAILIPLSIPAFSLHFGQTDTAALPTKETARVAYDDISHGFGVGTNGPLVIAVALARPAQPDDPQLAQLQQAVARTGGVVDVSPVAVDRAGTVATFSAIPSTAPADFATEDLVNHLRDTTIPDALRGTDLTAYVGGSTAALSTSPRRSPTSCRRRSW